MEPQSQRKQADDDEYQSHQACQLAVLPGPAFGMAVLGVVPSLGDGAAAWTMIVPVISAWYVHR